MNVIRAGARELRGLGQIDLRDLWKSAQHMQQDNKQLQTHSDGALVSARPPPRS